MASRGSNKILVALFPLIVIAYVIPSSHEIDPESRRDSKAGCPNGSISNEQCKFGSFCATSIYSHNDVICYKGPGDPCFTRNEDHKCHEGLVCRNNQCYGCIENNNKMVCYDSDLRPGNSSQKRFGWHFLKYTT